MENISLPERRPCALDGKNKFSQIGHNLSLVLEQRGHPAYPDAISPPLTQSQKMRAQSTWPTPLLNEELEPTVVNDALITTPSGGRQVEFAKSEIGSFLSSSGTQTESLEDGDQAPGKRRKLGMELSTSSSSIELRLASISQHGSRSNVQYSTRSFVYARSPPRTNVLLDGLPTYGLLPKEYRDPFYSVSEDLPERPREYAGLLFNLTRGSGTAFLPPWTVEYKAENVEPLQSETIDGWEYASWPPSKKRIAQWLKKEEQIGLKKGRAEGHSDGRSKHKPHVRPIFGQMCGAQQD